MENSDRENIDELLKILKFVNFFYCQKFAPYSNKCWLTSLNLHAHACKMKHVSCQTHMLTCVLSRLNWAYIANYQHRNYWELTMSKVGCPQGFGTIPNLPDLTWAYLESSVKLTTWLGGSESVNHLWTTNHNIIYI